MEMFHDMVRIFSASPLPRRSRRRPRSGRAETDGRQRPHPVFLRTLQTHKGKRRAHPEPPDA